MVHGDRFVFLIFASLQHRRVPLSSYTRSRSRVSQTRRRIQPRPKGPPELPRGGHLLFDHDPPRRPRQPRRLRSRERMLQRRERAVPQGVRRRYAGREGCQVQEGGGDQVDRILG